MSVYYRPLVQMDTARPAAACAIADGWGWFTLVERMERGKEPKIVPATEAPAEILHTLSRRRSPIAGLVLDRPRLMGILNVTPDSFSDGGKFDTENVAIQHGMNLVNAGADIVDIGGESTRPGAKTVPAPKEIERTSPVINAIRNRSPVPISIDTRKAPVAASALDAGANIVNDVSALTHDPELSRIVVKSGAPVCLMHALGDPETMQDSPIYDDVLLDVYDYLSERIDLACSLGVSRDQIIVDPGIGFGKTSFHNLALIRGISLFHGLGCPILLGTSRKRFIGTLAGEKDATRRMPGSNALALFGITQGVQITRVHDIAEMRQALTLWMAATGTGQQT